MTYRWYVHRPQVTNQYLECIGSSAADTDTVTVESEIRRLLDAATNTDTDTVVFFQLTEHQRALRLTDDLYALVEKIEDAVKYDFKVTDIISRLELNRRRQPPKKSADRRPANVTSPAPQLTSRPGGQMLLVWGDEEMECREQDLDDEIKRLTDEGVGIGEIRAWQEVKLSVSVMRAKSVGG